MPQLKSSSLSGIVYAVLAYTAWGLLPVYWKLFGQVPAVEVLCHRIIWSLAFLALVLLIQQRKTELIELWQSPRRIGMLLLTSCLLSLNWGIYIYGVNSDRVVESSLGYFINPLVSVLLGFIFLKERLHRGQQIAVALATIGVAFFILQFDAVPWIALGLAFTFAFYGLLRKLVPVAPLVGLAVETLLVTPIALLFVSYWAATGVGHFGLSWPLTLLFIGAGITTSFPLLWFNNAAKRLPLSTLGFLQYFAPSLQLLLGVFLYNEPFTQIHLVTFSLIWCALLIYTSTSLKLKSIR